jgi:hypothetical protein
MEKATRYLRIWPYVRREPRVASIDIWNVRDRILHNYGKTDNEGFHMKVGYTIGAQFPNLWKFLKALQGLQAKTEKLVQELNSGVILETVFTETLCSGNFSHGHLLRFQIRSNQSFFSAEISLQRPISEESILLI